MCLHLHLDRLFTKLKAKATELKGFTDWLLHDIVPIMLSMC